MEEKTITEKVKKVNKILLKGEPHNITEDLYSGFKATGYKPQYIVDAMNQVFGIDGWGFDEISNKIVGADYELEAVANVKVFIGESYRYAYGGKKFQWQKDGESKITDYADAKKSAQTDAIKKALSYFSVGNRAYHGKLKAN
jgi:recombination DNA repair RAD52 pathway protein